MSGIEPEATSKTDTQHPSVRHGAFQLRGVHCLGCAGAVERALREQAEVTEVRLDWKNDLVYVGYDPARIGSEGIEELIVQTGCDCAPVGPAEERREAMAPPERRMQHLGHGVDEQPISMGT